MRARAFVEHLGNDIDATIRYRDGSKLLSILRFFRESTRFRPDVVYSVDMAFSGVLAGGAYRLLARCRLIVDTGDAIVELARSVGERGRVGMWLTMALERFGFWVADSVVVRGTEHRNLLGELGKRVVVVQDGVDTKTFRPRDVEARRDELAPGGELTIGLVGSSVWSDRLGICYGWELVELVHALRDRPVVGVMVGGGSGIERLRARCEELGIEDRMRFVGIVPYDDLPDFLSAMDFCISTQTNDIPGRVRTTGKLPLYLAAGGVILATRVGEAALVLDERQLVEYEGVVDRGYPARLAARVRDLVEDAEARAEIVAANRTTARERFEYRRLTSRVHSLLGSVCGRQP